MKCNPENGTHKIQAESKMQGWGVGGGGGGLRFQERNNWNHFLRKTVEFVITWTLHPVCNNCWSMWSSLPECTGFDKYWGRTKPLDCQLARHSSVCWVLQVVWRDQPLWSLWLQRSDLVMRFPSVILTVAFISSQWGGLTHCHCDQRVSFLSAWSRLKPLLALLNDHSPSEEIDNEKWPWWDFSTMSKLLKVWHVGNPGARTTVSMEFPLYLLVVILSSMCCAL